MKPQRLLQLLRRCNAHWHVNVSAPTMENGLKQFHSRVRGTLKLLATQSQPNRSKYFRHSILNESFKVGNPVKKWCTLITATVALSGCASAIMKSYVDKPLSEAVMDYGPPITAFDVEPGRRAFIWNIRSSVTLPGTATTTGNLNMSGGAGFYSASTIINPPTTINSSCNYTLFAERIPGAPEGPAGWRIVGFRQPHLTCE